MGEGLLHPKPIRLLRPMWETGLFLNCNVYWDCPTACRYCFSRLNRIGHNVVGKSATNKALGTLTGLVNKAFGPKYDPTDALQFFLHEHYPVMVSNNSDPLSQLEVAHGYTRQYLEVLADCGSPVNLLSKWAGWEGLDQDAYLATFKRFDRFWASITITADNDASLAKWEPGAPSLEVRLKIIRQLTAAGIAVDVRVIPFFFTDSFPGGPWDDGTTYRPFLQQIKEAGAFGVSLSHLDFSIYDAYAIDETCKQYVRQHEWVCSQLDKPWAYFRPDPSIMAEVSRIWYEEATSLGLKCGVHQAVNSTTCREGDLYCAVVGPDWLDLSLSWVRAAQDFRCLQRQYGALIVATSRQVAEAITAEHRHADHQFSWKSWRDTLPSHATGDMDYEARCDTMPRQVSLADIMAFQMDELTWPDSILADLATAPVSVEAGNQLYDEEGGFAL